MLSLKSGLHLSVGVFAAIAIAVGCAGSTDDGGDLASDKKPTDPAKVDAGGTSKKLEAPNKDGGKANAASSSSGSSDDDDDVIGGPDDDGGASSSSSSSSSSSGAVDAGPPAPESGTSCSVQDELYTKTCGMCGKQQAICTTNRTGDLKVSDYGPCGGQPATAVCSAGDSQPCGNCGTKACGASCTWGSCKNEGVCKPGTISHDSAGCSEAGTYRSKTCEDTCSFGFLGACEDIVVPPQGQTISSQWELSTSSLGKRPSSCKKTATLTSVTGFSLRLRNTGSTDATVQIWHSSAGTSVDTVIATYANSPHTDDDFKACATEPQDSCDQLNNICSANGSGSWGGVDNVKVPANGAIYIYSSGWTNNTTGKFVLNVKTK